MPSFDDPRPESLLPLPAAVFHILMAVADEDRHGYAIIQEVIARTSGEVRLSPATLYRIRAADARTGPHRRDS